MNGHHALHAPKRNGNMTPEECAFADTKRAAGCSWATIARMLGRSEHDVRAACDTDFEEAE